MKKIKKGKLVEILTPDHATLDDRGWVDADEEPEEGPPIMKVAGYLIKETRNYFVLATWHGIKGKISEDFSTFHYVLKTRNMKIAVKK